MGCLTALFMLMVVGEVFGIEGVIVLLIIMAIDGTLESRASASSTQAAIDKLQRRIEELEMKGRR